MEVTIILGERAMEYVTGIPEDELPDILSDVLERSLAQQVKPVEQEVAEPKDTKDADLLGKIKAMLDKMTPSQNNTHQEVPKKKDTSTFSKHREIVVEKVEESSSAEDCLDVFDFFK